MSFKKRIDKILEAKQLERLSINKIERLLGVDGVIYKAHKGDYFPTDPNLISEMIRKLSIRQEWWDRDWETDSKDIFITRDDKPTDNSESDIQKYFHQVLEEKTAYRLIPKLILDEYNIIPKIEAQASIDKWKADERKWDEMLKSKNALIERLESEIDDLIKENKDLKESLMTPVVGAKKGK